MGRDSAGPIPGPSATPARTPGTRAAVDDGLADGSAFGSTWPPDGVLRLTVAGTPANDESWWTRGPGPAGGRAPTRGRSGGVGRLPILHSSKLSGPPWGPPTGAVADTTDLTSGRSAGTAWNAAGLDAAGGRGRGRAFPAGRRAGPRSPARRSGNRRHARGLGVTLTLGRPRQRGTDGPRAGAVPDALTAEGPRRVRVAVPGPRWQLRPGQGLAVGNPRRDEGAEGGAPGAGPFMTRVFFH